RAGEDGVRGRVPDQRRRRHGGDRRAERRRAAVCRPGVDPREGDDRVLRRRRRDPRRRSARPVPRRGVRGDGMDRITRFVSRLGGKLGIVVGLLGAVILYLGWNGAASHNDIRKQFPYLVSGGMAGLALVVVGAALLVI